jgi:DnaJ-class molecular chaperone
MGSNAAADKKLRLIAQAVKKQLKEVNPTTLEGHLQEVARLTNQANDDAEKKEILLASFGDELARNIARWTEGQSHADSINIIRRQLGGAEEDLEAQFTSLSQGNLTLTSWRVRVEDMGKRAKKTDKEIIRRFIAGLEDVDFRVRVQAVVDVSHGSIAISSLMDPRGQRDQRTCFNCNKTGHIARECTAQRKQRVDRTCRRCLKPGHRAEDCRAAMPNPDRFQGAPG